MLNRCNTSKNNEEKDSFLLNPYRNSTSLQKSNSITEDTIKSLNIHYSPTKKDSDSIDIEKTSNPSSFSSNLNKINVESNNRNYQLQVWLYVPSTPNL